MALPHRSVLVGLAALAMVATATPAMAAEPVGTIRSAGGATAVEGSYIVVFKDAEVGRNAVGSSVDRLVRRHGGSTARTWTAAVRGAELRVSAKAAARIAADPAVAYVEQNHTVTISGTQTNPPSWGLDRIDQRNLPLNSSYTYPNTASNVTSYVIDTGIRTTHSDFGGRATWGTNTVDTNNTDCNGHGTHVAGTVGGTAYGVAKATRLVAVKVLNCQGSGTNAGVIAGIDWVTANAVKPAVANMSLGGGANTSVDNAVINSINAGITYAVAAGNGNALGQRQNACNYSPARAAPAITVGATQNNDAAASFSNFGTCVDILAPGVSITSAWHTGDTATNSISGTSMASPHVAGVAALVLSANPSWTPQQVRDYLVANSTPNVITNVGTGTPNQLLYVVNGGTPPPTNDFSVSVSPTAGSTAPGGSVTTSVSTATTNGSAQSVSLSASGLPSGATASFSPATVTSGGSSTLTVTTSAGTPAGTYPVTVTGSAASGSRTATFSLTVTGSGSGGCTGSNGTDVAIPDAGSAVTSSITIAGCNRNAASNSTVAVNIVHTYRGDLVVDLLAPDGSSYRLKNSSILDGADNVIATYTVNLSSEAANGTWRLQVRDVYSGDTGYVNTWTLTL
ncbi:MULTISPECIES: S8 family serine peptidase [unclassified Micromonospora]|uniref:S8 family peptidase n=1 Tax=unclassified Micromonospora TaxID=2617518 RepID=UPI001034746F|nr:MULTISPECIES: S8 family serine peptidase [unclassified Micromonospora]QKW11381.1 S8 family serine peptidase [Verrucosispora sp. NA02020]TBL43283.1 peptidase S8/S53 subtilisin kexin sedolisin [Verrucosispora sp. SN26_14.1]